MAKSYDEGFVEALMKHLLYHCKIPKVQVERALGAILGLFIAGVLPPTLGDDLKMICAEFPLRKASRDISGCDQSTTSDGKQSTNIDWLLHSEKRDQLLFVELKTADTGFRSTQHQTYLRVIDRIRRGKSASFLLADVVTIAKASRKRAKYAELLNCLDEQYFQCDDARLVYLAPEAMVAAHSGRDDDRVEWLRFQDLRDISPKFPAEWSAIRRHLAHLDSPAQD